ncbi:MAG: hypothetical protein KatS3mg108_0905 [Isosphaeraceae bacterium]|jgi:type II secretory pathway component PulF|nr:MAG: hypothetical protein KatS3mg108_0905 [Isosphaeraceae bacterium]
MSGPESNPERGEGTGDPEPVETEWSRSPWEPLRRWRWVLAVVGLGAAVRLLGERFGWEVGSAAAFGVVAIGALVWLVEGDGLSPVGVLRWIGAAVLGVVGGLWGGPSVGVGVAVASLVVLKLRIWRLKLRHLMIVLVALAVGIRMVQVLGDVIWFVGLLVATPLVIGLVDLRVRRRLEHGREGLLEVLAIATRMGQPLGPAVAAWGELWPTRIRERMIALSRRLQVGEPLTAAVRQVPGVLPEEAALLVRLDLPGVPLSVALEQAVEAVAARRRDPTTWGSVVGYPLAILSAAGLAWMVLEIWVQPKLATIWRESAGDGADPGGGGVSWLLGELGLAWLGDVVRTEAVGWVGGVLVLGGLLVGLLRRGGVRVWLPWPSVCDERAVAGVMRSLSVGMELGRPVPEVLEASRAAAGRRWIRRRLGRSRALVTAGVDWPEALRRAGLMSRAEAGLARASSRSGHPGWALRELAAGRERRAVRRLRRLEIGLRVVALVVGGLLVLGAAAAYFGPLVRLIERYAEYW